MPDPVKKQARPVVPKPEPKAPRPSFRYIGFMGPKNNKIAVLEKGEQVLLAEIGEVVEKQFVVRSFKYEILVLGFTAERWKDETHELPMKR